MHGQLAAAAQAEAIDGGDQRLAETGDALPVGQTRVIEDADQVALGHFLDIGAGGEGLAAAGDDHDAGFGVLLGGVQFGGQLAQQFGIEGVERFRALQGDQADTLLRRQDGKGTRHVDCPQAARAASRPLLLVGSGRSLPVSVTLRAWRLWPEYTHKAIQNNCDKYDLCVSYVPSLLPKDRLPAFSCGGCAAYSLGFYG
ncbi:hypothetical protein D9M68_620050 [compost metagenome]